MIEEGLKVANVKKSVEALLDLLNLLGLREHLKGAKFPMLSREGERVSHTIYWEDFFRLYACTAHSPDIK